MRDIIGGSVPGWQVLKILLEGVEGINKFRIEHCPYVGGLSRFRFFAHTAPQGIDVAVCEFFVLPAASGCQHLALAGYGVLAKRCLTVEKLFNVCHRCHKLLPFIIVLRLAEWRKREAAMLFDVEGAGGKNACHVAIVVGKTFCCPLGGYVLCHSVGVEQIAHAHDIFVVVMFRIFHTFIRKATAGSVNHSLQTAVVFVFGRCRAMLGRSSFRIPAERYGIGIEKQMLVVCKSA